MGVAKLLFFASMLRCVASSVIPTAIIDDFTAPLIGDTRNDDLILKCAVAGVPPLSVSWEFNGDKIENDDLHSIEWTTNSDHLSHNTKHSIMTREKVTEDAIGSYKCLVTNHYGTVFDKVNVSKLLRYARFNISREGTLPIAEYELGKPARIPCPSHYEAEGYFYNWGEFTNMRPHFWESGKDSLENGFITKDGVLTFSVLSKSDVNSVNALGGVRCIFYSSGTIISRSAKVTVTSKAGEPVNRAPVLEAYMEEKFTVVKKNQKGDSFEILCGAVGYPQPAITWYKDGDKLTNNVQNFTTIGNGMRLHINPITTAAEGNYSCVASNLVGKDEKFGYLTVHEKPYFSKTMDEQEMVTFEKSLTLSCVGEGIPAVTYSWLFNGTQITSTNDAYKLATNKLTIESANFNHTGLYLCVVENYLGVSVQGTYVTVGSVAPVLLQAMKNPTYIFKQFNNTMECAFKSAPAPYIFWTKDGVNVTDPARYSTRGRGTGSLEIINVTDSDSGNYKCTAVNVKGRAVDETQVTAVVKTVITKAPVALKLKVGDSAVLFCDATYEKVKLNPKFSWLKDGKEFVDTESVFLEKRIDPPSRVIYFNNAPLTAGGEYACRVYTQDKNSGVIVSEDKKTAAVVVIGTPMPPSNFKQSGNCSAPNNITLSWSQQNHFGHVISYYVVEYAQKDDSDKNNWLRYDVKTKITAQPFVLQTIKLPPDTILKFRIHGVIEFEGSTYKSAQVIIVPDNCRTPVGPPTIAIVPVGKTDGPGKLVVEWDDNEMTQPGPDFSVIVQYRKIPDGVMVTQIVNDTNQLVVPADGPGEGYEVFVRPQNKKGLGPRTGPFQFKSGSNEIVGIPGNVQYKEDGGNVTISWVAVEHASTYKVYYSEVTDDEAENVRRRRKKRSDAEKVVEVDASTPPKAVLTDLSASKKYSVSVAASNNVGDGKRSDPLTFETKARAPGAPGAVDLDPLGDGLRVSWQPPTDSDDVTGYEVTYYKSDETPPKKVTKLLPADARETFITGLDPLAYYTVEVKAVNDEGSSKPWVRRGVAVGLPDVPGKPAPPEYTFLNDSTMIVKFVLPKSYFGGVPQNFTIYYYPKGEKSEEKSLERQFPSESNITLYSLKDSPYVIYAVGQNALGRGEPSDETIAKRVPDHEAVDETEPRPFYRELWFIILVVLLLLILLLLLIVCCCLCRRGGKYPVGEKEKDFGGWDNQPLKDYAEEPYDDKSATPILKNGKEPPRSGSAISLTKLPPTEEDDDNDSLDDYGEDTKFNEDGSFIGQYGGEGKNPPSSEVNGATMV